MLLVMVGIALLAGFAAFVLLVVLFGLVVLTIFLVLVALVVLAVGWYVVRRARTAQRMRGPSFAFSSC